MIKWVRSRLNTFFFPPQGSPRWLRVLPYAVLGAATLLFMVGSAYAWDYTNSPEFCGTACHTMPPEYTSYLTSPHARVDCVDCHIGEGFITTRITRKAGDAKHIIRLAFKDYEFPIHAKEMRPARETCEECHFPEKFSDDSLREIKHFGNDIDNSPTSIYLLMKTGGGSERTGLGRGIHWHIENPVYYYAEDSIEQSIPYVRVVDDDGNIREFIDIESGFDAGSIDQEKLEQMDCITCHNRITHMVFPPEELIDQLIERRLVSREIPEIRRKALEIFNNPYETTEFATLAIAGLENYYKTVHPDYYSENLHIIKDAITELQNAYNQSVFPEQKSDWNSHANNIGHDFTPGCFRCHDGRHLDQQEQAIRLECNLCHSIPVVADAYDFVAEIEISRGPEPQTHLNANWIGMHRDAFDPTCGNCHTIEDPGGVSNTSFCSNSACHGSVFTYAGFDAPALREIWLSQLPPPPDVPEIGEGPLTYNGVIGSLLEIRCGACHGATAVQGLDLSTYGAALKGSTTGAVILPGDAENSPLVVRQQESQPHFGQFSTEELDLIIQWITEGALEE